MLLILRWNGSLLFIDPKKEKRCRVSLIRWLSANPPNPCGFIQFSPLWHMVAFSFPDQVDLLSASIPCFHASPSPSFFFDPISSNKIIIETVSDNKLLRDLVNYWRSFLIQNIKILLHNRSLLYESWPPHVQTLFQFLDLFVLISAFNARSFLV